jgi:hypothetical protein
MNISKRQVLFLGDRVESLRPRACQLTFGADGNLLHPCELHPYEVAGFIFLPSCTFCLPQRTDRLDRERERKEGERGRKRGVHQHESFFDQIPVCWGVSLEQPKQGLPNSIVCGCTSMMEFGTYIKEARQRFSLTGITECAVGKLDLLNPIELGIDQTSFASNSGR